MLRIARKARASPSIRPHQEASMPKVLISDSLSPAAVQIFKDRGIDVDVKVGLSKDDLIKIIGDYDGLAIRSATKVTPPVIEAATRQKVVGRDRKSVV